LDEPHLASTGFFKPRIHPTEGKYFEMKPPIKFSDAATVPSRFPPKLGEQSDDIRAEQSSKSK
jgi:crotonobetainyl-CoA:carnitine CoA-transferase CaiB-like acyl-CoA transferase